MNILKLDQDNTFTLQDEKVQGKWRLELIHRATGQAQIVVCDTKKHAQTCDTGRVYIASHEID